jgi:hypothetical protein
VEEQAIQHMKRALILFKKSSSIAKLAFGKDHLLYLKSKKAFKKLYNVLVFLYKFHMKRRFRDKDNCNFEFVLQGESISNPSRNSIISN